jgi:hypothetical protein
MRGYSSARWQTVAILTLALGTTLYCSREEQDRRSPEDATAESGGGESLGALATSKSTSIATSISTSAPDLSASPPPAPDPNCGGATLLTIDAPPLELYVGDATQLLASVRRADGTVALVSARWTAASPVLRVSADGWSETLKAGAASVSATACGLSASRALTVLSGTNPFTQQICTQLAQGIEVTAQAVAACPRPAAPTPKPACDNALSAWSSDNALLADCVAGGMDCTADTARVAASEAAYLRCLGGDAGTACAASAAALRRQCDGYVAACPGLATPRGCTP